ncbi:MAG: CinA family protein [Deltaproteobacteria bacterium]|jgi:nicotinamide-nucleotide amidase|nr:CinA family protein [Deltaproteobacteria bacterium]
MPAKDTYRENLISPVLQLQAKIIAPRLIELGLTVGAAESLTGGLVSAVLSFVPGSSAFFLGSVVAYANSAKRDILGVEEEILDTKGAVSAQAALAMAEGIKNLTGAAIGLATTGIAGPDGGSRDKPVGLCYLAAVGLGHELLTEQIFTGSRHLIAEEAVVSLMALLTKILNRPVLA